ncbi:MAG TPA: glycoside hydrolase family 2 TIM barrel-domain containing protein [Longimicrobium sp.]|uniref:glycoside hydrolase family 2 protein n=1 Tax=Longimicrobium sp. TaxID=2029185 RepID=UPI002ED92C2F
MFLTRALAAPVRTRFWLIAMTVLASLPAAAQDAPRRLDLSGGWRYLPNNGPALYAAPGLDDSRWPEMRLPSNWFLLGADHYPRNADRGVQRAGPGDIWAVDPERGLDWGGTVWYRREVEWPAGGTRPVLLELDMVDYYADVYVNGQHAGSHEGYFQKWEVDVTRLIRPGRNLIALRVSAPDLPFDMGYRWPISWPKQQNQVKGIFLYHDTRPGATSPRGQERSTGGVIRGVALRESPGVEIERLTVLPTDVSEASATLVIEAQVHNRTAARVRGSIQGAVVPASFSASTRVPVRMEVDAAPGVSTVRAEVRVDRPRLWWSWDQGEPNRYRLDAALTREGGDSHRASATFGIRSITRDSAWVWRLNGRRIYPRGTNYISTQWLSQADRRWYERDGELLVGANLNTVRVHAHLERPEFYEVADSLGLMVWQDFPLQWGYTDDPAFHAEALRQAADMVHRFGNHPSIIAWCMHNEAPHAMEWMKKIDPQQNLALDEALTALARRMDPTRVHHRDSGTGDAHPYPGWYYGTVGGFWNAKDGPFITEYGAQALPNRETLRTMFPGDTLFPDTPADWEEWRFRNFQPEQAWTFGQMERGATLDEFVRTSQTYQAQVVRFGTEVFRRRKWAAENPTTGLYQFMFVEDWPSVTWAVVDYERRTKPGYDALRLAMQPVLPSIEYRIDDRDHPIALWIVNDLPRAFPGAVLRWRITSADEAQEVAGERRLDVAADSVHRVETLGPLPAVTRGGSTLEAWIAAADGTILGRSTLTARDFRNKR